MIKLYLEVLIILIKSIVKMLGVFLTSALAGAVLIGAGAMIYNRKKIVKILRRIAAGY